MYRKKQYGENTKRRDARKETWRGDIQYKETYEGKYRGNIQKGNIARGTYANSEEGHTEEGNTEGDI